MDAQNDSAQDIPLALTIGANHLDTLANRARSSDKKTLKEAGAALRALADSRLPFYDDASTAAILTPSLIELAAKYPNLPYADALRRRTPHLGRPQARPLLDLVRTLSTLDIADPWRARHSSRCRGTRPGDRRDGLRRALHAAHPSHRRGPSAKARTTP